MDILTILFTSVFVIFLPLGQLVRIPMGNGFTLVGLDAVVCLTAIVWLVYTILKKQKPYSFTLPIGLFLASGVVSLVANLFWLQPVAFLVSFLYLFRLGCYFTFIWIGYDIAKKSPGFVKKVLLVGGGIIMALGIVQYLFYPSLHPYLYLGWDDHFYRVFSTFLDPNFVGSFLVLYFFFVLYVWIDGWKKNTMQVKLKKEKLFFFALAGGTLIAILLTYSRSAYLMLGVGIILFLWNFRLRKWIVGAMLMLAVIIVLLGIFHRYGEGNNLLRTASISSRLGSMATAATLFSKEPIFGVGFDSYRYAQRRYGFLQGNLWEVTHAGAGTSNSFLFVLATTGIVGLGAYVFFLYTIVQRGREVSKKKKFLGILLTVSLLSLCANAFFENTLFYPSIMLWIFTLTGLTG